MKKWIAVLIILGLLVGGWWAVRTFVRVQLPGDEPKFDKITRGDVRVPITAAGLIEPYQRIEIKPEASGEIIDIKVVEGDFVHVDDVLLQIKRDDEDRNVARAKDFVTRARAALAKAEVAVKTSEANIIISQARIAELEQTEIRANYDLDREKRMSPGITTEQQLMLVETAVEIVKAQLRAARQTAENAKYAKTDAEETVKIQEAAVGEAEKDLKEAEQRLKETTVVSKHEAIVTEVKVKKQTIVQTGKSAFGGTAMLTIADVSKLKVITRVDEADYGRVANVSPPEAMPEMPGRRETIERSVEDLERRSGKVTVTVDAFPEKTFAGVIERVEPQGKLNAGASIIQFDVHVELTDEHRYMLPLGAQAQVEFTVESVKDVLVIPADAVKQFENEKGVYIRGGTQRDAKPRFIKCRFGITDGSITHLVGALSESDNELLKEGVEVYTKLPVIRDEEKK